MKLYAVCASALGASLLAGTVNATTVVIPDTGTQYFGTGNASVTYDGVRFSTSAAISNGNFFNVGSATSGAPAVVSSQAETAGAANIEITLPTPTMDFSVTYGTFSGSTVTFTLSNGATFTEPSTSHSTVDYATVDFQSFSSAPFDTVLLVAGDGDALNISSISYGVSAPEPAAWTLMLVGMGLAGSTLRRRRGAAA